MLGGVRLCRDELIAPLFVCPGTDVQREIASMPGQFQFSGDKAMETIRRWSDLGLPAVLLFGLPDHKDDTGSAAWDGNQPVQQLISQVKHDLPSMLVFTDVCLCEYTSHGHCGPLKQTGADTGGPRIGFGAAVSGTGVPPVSSNTTAIGSATSSTHSHHPRNEETHGRDAHATVDNDAAIELLGKVAVSHAQAGADVVAPSAMMDGQVAAIRGALDRAGFVETPILSYAVKFASCLYGPFRDAAQSCPQSGDRRSYQMDYRAPRQATLEAQCDIDEGTDMLMVKPAAAYLDVIAQVRAQSPLPLAAYHVSGEYSMIKAASANGWLDEKAAALEITSAIKRAGADLIITYFAEQLAQWLAQ
jgi:porphobilinogen synthase